MASPPPGFHDLAVYIATLLAGERSAGSLTGVDHVAVAGGWGVKEVDHADGDTDIWPGPCLLAAYEVTEAFSAHAWTIDGSNAPDITIAASATLGTSKSFPPSGGPSGQIMDTKLTVKPHASATAGKLRVWYLPLPASVTWATP